MSERPDRIDPIDALLTDGPGLDDAAFTERVLARLPHHRRDGLRWAALGASAAVAAGLAAVYLPGLLRQAPALLAAMRPTLGAYALAGAALILAAAAEGLVAALEA